MMKTLMIATAALLSVSTGARTARADDSATALLPPAPYHPPRAVSPQQQKLIFYRFVDGFLLTGNPLQALQDHLADDYIQHNPAFLSGKATVVQAFGGDISAFMTFPANVITRGFDEDQHHGWVQYYFTPAPGAQPDVIVDIFRMNGSAIQEHWDVIQRRPANATNPLAMFTPPQN